MDIPFFYVSELDQASGSLFLDDTASRHAIQVLRLKVGDPIRLCNGRGLTATANIAEAGKKKAGISVEKTFFQERQGNKVAIAISLVKNVARFEWFLEKATEIGVAEIIPLICQRTERQVFKEERFKSILVSAMLQSQQLWLPALSQPLKFEKATEGLSYDQKFIAHCEKAERQELTRFTNPAADKLILIGPEGDFTGEEIQLAMEKGFAPVSLGDTRLRTETAGMVAAALLRIA